MLGIVKASVRNSRNTYSFELRRNITILKGESGRGKTTLYDMIWEYNRFGKNSGVTVSCDRDIIAVNGADWQESIEKHSGTVIVIDEDSRFIRSADFARVVRDSDNYFLLITRNYLSELPISVEEIYELTGKKNKHFKKVYIEKHRMYNNPSDSLLPFKPEAIVTEDSGAGFQFFENEARKLGIECISAEGKTKVFEKVNGISNKDVVVIADGAAFGAEIEDLVGLQRERPRKLALFLPESFEWILLNADVVPGVEKDILDNTEMFADSQQYMSWERFFTDYLKQITKQIKYLKYNKSKLAPYYLQDKTADKIKSMIKGIDLS